MAIENRGPQLQAVCWVLVSTAAITTLLRCYVRRFIVKNHGFDDWCMVAAMISFILFVTCALLGVQSGTGRHHRDLTDEQIQTAMKYWWFCYLWYCTTMIASKISIAYFLLRITVRRVDIWIIHSVVVTTVLTGIVFFFVTMFQCNPVSFFWNRAQPGSCLDMEVIMAMTYVYSVFSVICDFTFAILPATLIWNLNMDRRTKFALVPIISMACVASAAVVARFGFIKDFKNPDFLYATTDIAIWSTTEQGLAITAGSLATLRPLFRLINARLGLVSLTPNELQNSAQPSRLPSGARIPTPKGARSQVRENLSLHSIREHPREGRQSDDLERSDSERSYDNRIETSKRASVWTSERLGNNESEEELTSTDRTASNQGGIWKMTSFKVETDYV